MKTIGAIAVAIGVALGAAWAIKTYTPIGCGEFDAKDYAALSVVTDAKLDKEGTGNLSYAEQIAALRKLEVWTETQPDMCVRFSYSRWIDASRRNLEDPPSNSAKGRDLAEKGEYPRPSFVPVRP